MKQERILISEDTAEVRKQVYDIKSKLISQLISIQKLYPELRAGEFTPDILEAIQSMDIIHVEETIYAKLRNQVTGTMLDDLLIKQASTKVNAICNKVHALYDTECCYDLIAHVAFDNGTFYVPDEAIESIKEENRVYVYSEKGKELYRAHKAAAKALSKLYSMAKDNITGNVNGLMTLFEISDDETVIPTEQDYEAYQYSRQK